MPIRSSNKSNKRASRTLLVLAGLFFATEAFTQAGTLQLVDAGGCRVFQPASFPSYARIRWQGGCSEGLVDGKGLMYFDIQGSRSIQSATYQAGRRVGSYTRYLVRVSGTIRKISSDGSSAPFSDVEVSKNDLPDWALPLTNDDAWRASIAGQPAVASNTQTQKPDAGDRQTARAVTVTEGVRQCKMERSEPLKENQRIRWLGSCSNGLMHGNGTLEWYESDIKSWIDEFTTENGWTMENGRPRFTIDWNSVEMQIQKCSRTGNEWREVKVEVRRPIELGYWGIARVIMERALQFANDRCPIGNRNQMHVRMFYKDGSIEQLYCDARAQDKLDCNNGFQYMASSSIDERLREARTKELMAGRAREEQARKAQAERQEQARKERLAVFLKQYKVEKWADSSLFANPFAFQGQTVVLFADFEQMLTPTSGVFSGAVVSDLPRGALTRRGEVLIVGRVLGNTQFNELGMGARMVPHLKFVGLHICQASGCREMLRPRE